MSYKWIKIQTHVHTVNSDGSDTLRDMACAAGKKGINLIFLTDHNTMYGYRDADDISKETGVKIIKAIEYTTFYGHIITVGAPYFRWENLKKDSLNKLEDHVHKYGGIIGIAHPMAAGNPVCTGGRYSFIDFNFSKVDFIEEWHGITNNHNEWEKNEEFWKDKVDKGNVITTLYGGDFHKKEHFKESSAFNWILIDDSKPIESEVINAIRCGKVIMSKGPCMDVKVKKLNKAYSMGDIIEIREDEKISIIVDVNKDTVCDSITLVLKDNCGEENIFELNQDYVEIYTNNNLKWIKAEILDKRSGEVLAESNPIYFRHI